MANNNMKEQLISLGWSVKAEIFEGGNQQRIGDLKKYLLDSDLRQSGEKSLPELAKLDQTTKSYIVQLHKTRNVTAPKDNENSSHRAHLYRLILTDGHVFQNALVLPALKNFNLDTPPGTKILLKPKTKISNGFYLLNDQTCEVLGGNVTELVQKWKLNKLMGKHVRILIGEGAPPPWVPFGVRHPGATTTVDTSQRAMDVVKIQQPGDEDPEFVRIRRAAIDTLLTSQISKTQRFANQDVMKSVNVAKGFEQLNRRGPSESSSTISSSVSNKPSNMTATVAAIKTNTRLPDWAKNQIADEPTEEEKRRPQSDRKPASRRNFDDDDDDRPRRGGGFGRNRRGRGRDDDGGEETRPSKDVTLFDFLESKSKSTQQKAAAAAPPNTANPPAPPSQKFDSKTAQVTSAPSNKPPSFVQSQAASASHQSSVSNAVQKQIFGYENGDQVLARYPEDNEYYPAIIMNIMYDSQTCAVMFEGYDTQEILTFDDIEPYEEGYYDEEGEGQQEQIPPPSSQRQTAAAAQYQQPVQGRNRPNTGGQQRPQAAYSQHPQQYDQSAYGHYNQQNRNRPNSGRGYPPQQQQQQQQYPHPHNNNYYY